MTVAPKDAFGYKGVLGPTRCRNGRQAAAPGSCNKGVKT